MIIGLSGKMQSGKNTVAAIIQYLIYQDKTENPSLSLNSFLNNAFIGDSYSGFIQKSFAHKLKKIVSILTGIPVEDLEKQEVKDSRLPECWHKFDDNNHYVEPDNVRELLQTLGTDLLRNQLHPNVFVNALFVDYITKKYSVGIDKYGYQTIVYKHPSWIVTDIRFLNELQAIKDRGGITIRVNREHKKTSKEWQELYPDIIVLDPDGWSRDERYDFEWNKELITLKEYQNRVSRSTCKFKTDFNNCFKQNEHPSETSLDLATFDYVIDNNGTIEELVIKVKEILIKEKILW